jgi:hypothetical protein
VAGWLTEWRLFGGHWIPSDLARNERLTSRNGRFHAILADDSNFVVENNGNIIWSSNTAGRPANLHLILQGNGNLVLYNTPIPGSNDHPHLGPVWESATTGGGHNPRLVMRNDGNLVL